MASLQSPSAVEFFGIFIINATYILSSPTHHFQAAKSTLVKCLSLLLESFRTDHAADSHFIYIPSDPGLARLTQRWTRLVNDCSARRCRPVFFKLVSQCSRPPGSLGTRPTCLLKGKARTSTLERRRLVNSAPGVVFGLTIPSIRPRNRDVFWPPGQMDQATPELPRPGLLLQSRVRVRVASLRTTACQCHASVMVYWMRCLRVQ